MGAGFAGAAGLGSLGAGLVGLLGGGAQAPQQFQLPGMGQAAGGSLGGIGCNVDHRFIWESGPGFPYVKERKGAVMPGMSESNGVTDIIRLRVVFALLPEGTVPSVVATIAGSEWATRHDEMEWMDATKKTWGLTHDDFRVISVEFPYRVAMPLFDPPSADA